MAKMNELILETIAKKVYPNGLRIGETKKEAKKKC